MPGSLCCEQGLLVSRGVSVSASAVSAGHAWDEDYCCSSGRETEEGEDEDEDERTGKAGEGRGRLEDLDGTGGTRYVVVRWP